LNYLSFVLIVLAVILSMACEKDNPVSQAEDTITDIDGNVYEIIEIGDQWWMAENLKVTRYRNVEMIPNVTGDIDWYNLTIGAWAFYNNNSLYGELYGNLYNWFAINDERGLCPEGWKVPTDEDWSILIRYLDTNAAGKMKSIRTEPDPHPRWISPNTGATNESGFSGLPGGARDYAGSFNYLGNHGSWWSSIERDLQNAWGRALYSGWGEVGRGQLYKRDGFSVRCVRDD
jgi:uncharacterized protein (TIGR02145 family)